MFVSQVVGRSMEPLIPDASYCIFRRIPAGTRQGKVVLAQHHGIADVETGGSYTVKRYESQKQESDGERAAHAEIVGAVLSAARVPGSISTVDVFGAAVSVRIVPTRQGSPCSR